MGFDLIKLDVNDGLHKADDETIAYCTKWLENKRRLCGRQHVKNQDPALCGMHTQNLLKCMYCGSGIRADRMSRHISLGKCPWLSRQQEEWAKGLCVKGINGINGYEQVQQQQVQNEEAIEGGLDEEMRSRLRAIVSGYEDDEFDTGIKWEDLGNDDVEMEKKREKWSEISNSGRRYEKRHFEQMWHLMKLMCIDQGGGTVVEIGAGRGGMSLMIAERWHELGIHGRFVLVDRECRKRKVDSRVESQLGMEIRRVKADLRDLAWERVVEGEKECVWVIGKHVCGEGLDAGLRGVRRLVRKTDMKAVKVKVVIAACCRGVCVWGGVGEGEIWREWGIGGGEFEEMRRMACKKVKEEDGDEEICRKVIDWGRVEAMRREGWSGRRATYISKEMSAENGCIVAEWHSTSKTP